MKYPAHVREHLGTSLYLTFLLIIDCVMFKRGAIAYLLTISFMSYSPTLFFKLSNFHLQ